MHAHVIFIISPTKVDYLNETSVVIIKTSGSAYSWSCSDTQRNTVAHALSLKRKLIAIILLNKRHTDIKSM